MNEALQQTLDEVVRRVVEVARPERIILFGSAARNEMTERSDLDLLVIKRGRYRRGLLESAIYERLRGVGLAVDVVVVTPEDVERYGSSPALVIAPALREGQLIYAAPGDEQGDQPCDEVLDEGGEVPMDPGRLPPDDPREWLNRARSNLILARQQTAGVYLEELCFNAQQAAEKALKAVLLHRGAEFPYTHDLAELIRALERAGESVPEPARRADQLSRFAVATRYPGVDSVTGEEYAEAVGVAEAVVQWAEERLRLST